MESLKLTIDLLPRGAWNTNLSKTLPKAEWDVIRNNKYKKANYKCACCEKETNEPEAHEVWDFDIKNKKQTLKDIIALCPACHGVKHIRHSQLIGYGEHARLHFMKVNNCDFNTFMKHYLVAQDLFEKQSKIDKWIMEVPKEVL